jgi:vitamin B12 transporter
MRAVFLQDQWRGERTRTFVAARFSDHETFGSEVTWNGEIAWDATDRLTLTAGAGRAFRAPDATDRFGFGGNAGLEAEVSQEIQAGFRYDVADRHRLTLGFYDNRIDELIEFDSVTFSLVNIDEARIRGAEIGYDYQGDGYSLGATLVNQRADNDTTGTRLFRRAEQSVSVRYRQSIGEHLVGLSVLASGDREDFGGARLAGYVLANLTGQFRLADRLQLNVRIENLLDTDYETAAGFRMQERSAFVELRTAWN